MRHSGNLILALFLSVLVGGCTATLQRIQNLMASPAEAYRERALAFEKQDEPRQAILCWEVVAQLAPDKTDVHKAINSLKLKAAEEAQGHFQRGLKHFQAGDSHKAKREFLTALRLDPDHQQARFFLKTRLQNPDQAIYRVQAGDSFNKIAADVYKDPSKAYWVAYFNDMDPRKPLLIGTHLLLPEIAGEYLASRSDIEELLEKARQAYKEKRFSRVYSLTGSILKEIPHHPKARRLADSARFEQGMELLHQGRYLDAIDLFKQVDPRFPGRNKAIAKARRQVSEQSLDVKLEEARGMLRNADWRGVIKVTEEILKQDPVNDEAKMLFSNASYKLGKILLDRGQADKAMDILSRIEPSYEDTGQLLTVARARMKAQAEALYRDGVKQFVNEELEKAIKTWKKVLELNPDHAKARQDMENAQRLLEKLRALEQKSPDTEKNQ
jgi:tetratricopeptide (TPR) repeat protein